MKNILNVEIIELDSDQLQLASGGLDLTGVRRSDNVEVQASPGGGMFYTMSGLGYITGLYVQN